MQVLYNFSLAEMAILDFQIGLSRFCIAARVMALRCEISGELWVDEWTNSSATATSCPGSVIVDGTSSLLPKAWTFVFRQFSSLCYRWILMKLIWQLVAYRLTVWIEQWWLVTCTDDRTCRILSVTCVCVAADWQTVHLDRSQRKSKVEEVGRHRTVIPN